MALNRSKKKLFTVLLLLLLLVSSFYGCGTAAEEATPEESAVPVELSISAAASLTEALTEIQEAYEAESGNTLLLNFGSSGTLQKQIEEGAPCDLYISASTKHMDALSAAGLIDEASRIDLLGNT
ncbi:MAG: molybdate ABC transporter substrate-binding protein, partial [Eubacteriales bacterium]|nr:molybdate ABC transporter substrate-binding protein [Eubacteriales bacterium]